MTQQWDCSFFGDYKPNQNTRELNIRGKNVSELIVFMILFLLGSALLIYHMMKSRRVLKMLNQYTEVKINIGLIGVGCLQILSYWYPIAAYTIGFEKYFCQNISFYLINQAPLLQQYIFAQINRQTYYILTKRALMLWSDRSKYIGPYFKYLNRIYFSLCTFSCIMAMLFVCHPKTINIAYGLILLYFSTFDPLLLYTIWKYVKERKQSALVNEDLKRRLRILKFLWIANLVGFIVREAYLFIRILANNDVSNFILDWKLTEHQNSDRIVWSILVFVFFLFQDFFPRLCMVLLYMKLG